MATRKTAKTIETVTKKAVGHAKKKLRAAPRRPTAKTTKTAARNGGKKTAGALAPYAVPGAAVLGSGVLAAAGFLLREQLGHVLLSAARSVVAGGLGARHAAAKELELGRLLSHVGLQPRRSPVLGAGLGALAGIAAGTALAMWLGPMVRDAMADKEPTVEKKSSSFVPEEPAMERRVTLDGAA
jgi:hypothetical protein